MSPALWNLNLVENKTHVTAKLWVEWYHILHRVFIRFFKIHRHCPPLHFPNLFLENCLFNIALNNSPSYFKNKRWILETREFRFVEGSWEFICPGQEKLLLTLLCLSLKTTDQDSKKSRMILGFLTWRVLIAHLKKKKKALYIQHWKLNCKVNSYKLSTDSHIRKF